MKVRGDRSAFLKFALIFLNNFLRNSLKKITKHSTLEKIMLNKNSKLFPIYVSLVILSRARRYEKSKILCEEADSCILERETLKINFTFTNFLFFYKNILF